MARQALLLSIRPRYADLIFSGEKTVELRRVRPRLQAGDLVIVYESAPVKAMRGAFEVRQVLWGPPGAIWKEVSERSGLTRNEFDAYFQGAGQAYAIVVGGTWPFAAGLTLDALRKRRARFQPPQGYRYLLPQEAVEFGIADLIRPEALRQRSNNQHAATSLGRCC